MEPTEPNLQAWDAAHRQRGEAVAPARGLPEHVRRTLGTLEGKRVLHLGCGTGEATAELASLGAVATGVDPEAAHLDEARRRWPAILWVDADPQALPAELLRGRFDLVYATGRALRASGDLDALAHGAAGALRPRGELLLHDEHPVALRIDTLMHWHGDYFDGPPRLGRVTTAVARAGFAVRALEEYPAAPHNPRRHDRRVPGEFLLYAEKEA